jgi:hypothetical protein
MKSSINPRSIRKKAEHVVDIRSLFLFLAYNEVKNMHGENLVFLYVREQEDLL